MINSKLSKRKYLCLIHFLLSTKYILWLSKRKVTIIHFLPPLVNLYPLSMLLINASHKEEEEDTLVDPSLLDIVHFVERTITLLNIVIRSMDIQIQTFRGIVLMWMPQVALKKSRLNQEVAMMLLHLLVPIFLRRSMISCLACYNKWICFLHHL